MVVPELLGPLDQYQKFDLSRETLAQARRESDERTFALYTPRPGVTTVEQTVPGEPPVRVLVSQRAERGLDRRAEPTGARQARAEPTGARRPGVLWIHGGGYVLGIAERCRPVLDMLGTELDCVAVSAEYRLAPETPHPGPLEDCYAALVWMHANADELGIDPDRIAVGGESAGGGLAAGLAILARDRGGPRIAHQALVYPMLDDRTVTVAEPNPYAGEFVWTPASNEFGWRSLLGEQGPGGADISPYAAPARVTDPAGLPPATVVTGTLDLFVDEDIAYATRLVRAGVPTELLVYPGAFHGFFSFEATELGRRVRSDITEALRRSVS